MAIDQHAKAETPLRLADQLAQHGVIGPVIAFDAPQRFGHRQLAAIDLLAGGDDARDHAKPGGNPRGIRVGFRRQLVLEHLGIELEGLAVGIDEGAGEEC